MQESGKRFRVLLLGSIAALFIIVLAGVLVSIGDDGQDRSPGHERMVVLLRDIERRTPEHWLLGDRSARDLRQFLASLPETAPAATRCGACFHLGMEELQLGREREAIALLTRAHGLLPRLRGSMEDEHHHEVIFNLGLAYLRLGETQNCCLRNNPDSCLLPIRGGGIHSNEEGSRQAIVYFLELLSATDSAAPIHLQARWLLNVAYMTLGEYPDRVPTKYLIPPRAFDSEEPFPRFTNIAGRLGLNTFSLSGGAIADDFDGDDYLDLAVSSYDTREPLRLFRNNRDGTFSERSEEAGLSGILGGLNMVQADYDNDGDVDFFVLRGAWLFAGGRHPNSLLRNRGDGTFEDVTFAAGLGEVHYPTQTASWADYDNDGDLDLYVGNELTEKLDAPCQLFRNNGDGTFTDVARSAGVTNERFTKGVIWGDFDDDRFPDIYVANLDGPNRLYRNNGDGTFTDVAEKLGVTRPFSSFPCWFWDFDNDGALDIFASSYAGDVADSAAAVLGLPFQAELPCLYRGDGKGGFEEVGRRRNLKIPSLPMGANFGDLDGDGYLDFYLGTGDPDYRNLMPSIMYRNRRGQGFADVTTNGGFGNLQKGHAIAFADFDNDGDQDVFAQMGGAYPGDRYNDCFYENPGFGRHWITVKLVGVRSNRSAIGSRIRVVVSEEGRQRTIHRRVNSGGTFGANPLRQNIGLGEAEKILRLEVMWPTSGETQTFRNVPLDRCVEIVEGKDSLRILDLKRLELGGAPR